MSRNRRRLSLPPVRIASGEQLVALAADYAARLPVPRTAADAVQYVFCELGRNALSHAHAHGSLFVCADHSARAGVLAIAVADSGIGIGASLAEHHRAAGTRDAIRLALWPGVTGTTPLIGGRAFHAGAGLFFVRSLAALMGTAFVLCSGSTSFRLLRTPGGARRIHADVFRHPHRLREGLRPWHGTVIGVELALVPASGLTRRLDRIRRAYVQYALETAGAGTMPPP